MNDWGIWGLIPDRKKYINYIFLNKCPFSKKKKSDSEEHFFIGFGNRKTCFSLFFLI